MSDLAVTRDKFSFVDAGQLSDPNNAVLAEALLHGLAHAPQQADRLVGEEGSGLGPANHGEAARLVQVRGDLGEELVVAEPNGNSDRKLLLHRRASAARVAAGLAR